MSDTFLPFQKIPRLKRACVITEKIDGTNACIHISDNGKFSTGSRNRWITPAEDNFGFSRWAHDHKEELLKLGPGYHYGEWWGSGIQRRYGIIEKRWSLFNVGRWCAHDAVPDGKQQCAPSCCHVVPTIRQSDTFSTIEISEVLEMLRIGGSLAAPGFMNPEGIIIYHTASKALFKCTIENDGEPKGKFTI